MKKKVKHLRKKICKKDIIEFLGSISFGTIGALFIIAGF